MSVGAVTVGRVWEVERRRKGLMRVLHAKVGTGMERWEGRSPVVAAASTSTRVLVVGPCRGGRMMEKASMGATGRVARRSWLFVVALSDSVIARPT